MRIRQKAVFSKKCLIFLLLIAVSFLWPSSPVYAEKEKIGVLFLNVGEPEDYAADWGVQFFNNMLDVYDRGWLAGGTLDGGTCYSLIHYANEAEASICGVSQGTPIDQFCHPYTGSYTIHSLFRHWPVYMGGDGNFELNCLTPIGPIMYVLTFGHSTIRPSDGRPIVGPHVDDPAGSGIGIADFVEMANFSRMNLFYRFPDYTNYNRQELLKWWYGNDAPGYPLDSPELINVKDALEALHPEYDFIYRQGWEGYMENKDPYGDPAYNPNSTETAIEELIDAGVQRIIVAGSYAAYSNTTQYGHEWYENGQPISALPGKTFKECVEDLTDGKGPATQADLDAYHADKPWIKHEDHPFPLIKKFVQNLAPTMDLRFGKPYGSYPAFEQAVVDMINYTVAKYSIPPTTSLKVVLATHGFVPGYKNAMECDSYFRLTDDLATRVIAKVQSNFTWTGKFDVVAAPAEFSEGTYDVPSADKHFGNIISAGEIVDQSINGEYVDGWGTLVDNGTDKYNFIIVIPLIWEAFSSDTVYGKRENILANSNFDNASSFLYVRDIVDQDGSDYDTGDIDPEYFTHKMYDASGWPGVPGCMEDPDCMTNNLPVNKGSATNPTTIIITGSILDLNSSSGYGRSIRQGLTDALVRSIAEALQEPTLITLASFDAVPGNRSVTLRWSTESEVDNAGFNLYRSETENGVYVRMNGALIPAEGSSTQGATYEFVDTGLKNGVKYYYILEDIDIKGKAEKHGPESATPRLIYAPLSR
jgi:hypothetical protein